MDVVAPCHEDVHEVRVLQRALDVLLDDEHGRVELRDPLDLVPHDVGVGGRETGGRLVEDDHRRVDHERPRDREQVLLAAREEAGLLLRRLAEVGEDLEDLLHARRGVALRGEPADLEVLAHRQSLEDVVVLRHVDEAVPRDLVARASW